MTDRDLARAIIAKLDRDRRVPSILPATVVGISDDPESQPIPLAQVEIDGNPSGMINTVPIATAGRLSIGQRVLVHFDPPAGAYIIGTITRGAGVGRPYATVVIAAADSIAEGHEAADVVCAGDGTDMAVIAAVFGELFSDGVFVGGRVLLLEGTYVGDAGLINVPGGHRLLGGDPAPSAELAGVGPGTRLVFSGAGYGVFANGGNVTNLTILTNTLTGGGVTPFYCGNGGTIAHVSVGFYFGGSPE